MIEQAQEKTNHILVDFHAETTSEKIAMGWHLDGRASIVLGTHTHVQTNDDTILPNGTAYITDVGMTGPKDGVLGMKSDAVLYKFTTQLPARFVVSEGPWHLHAISVQLDDSTGKATKIEKVRLTEDEWLLMS